MDTGTKPSAVVANPEVNFFGLANYRNQNRRFGIKLDDRRRHMYVVGKTGMGKTTMLENMVLNDVYAGRGLCYVDPHGDTAEKIINFIPSNRINDVVYFNPSDINYPIGFNILETIRPEQKHLVASGLMGVFKKIWPDVWSSRMEYILNNTILALLDFPGTTLLGINRLLADADYRRRVVRNVRDPVVKSFWQTEFANYNDKYRQEAVAPIQNKIGQFLSASVIRNIVAQVKSRINIREIMDNKKIFIINLSKGRIGEDNSRLLGGLLITKLQLSAMERVEMPEATRPDFFLYVDEFQNFATESFANILSEARKYHLDLIMAHQYMEQLEEEVLAAVIGNVGSIITFRVGSTDAEILAKEYMPHFTEEDLVNLPKYHIYLKLMIDGVASKPFSALTLPPIAQATGSMEKVVRVSRERYASPKERIEDKIARWSGMIIIPEDDAEELEVDEDEEIFADVPKTAPVFPVAPVIPLTYVEGIQSPPLTPVIPAKAGIQSHTTVIPNPSTSLRVNSERNIHHSPSSSVIPTNPPIRRGAEESLKAKNNQNPNSSFQSQNTSPVIPVKTGIQSSYQTPQPLFNEPHKKHRKKKKNRSNQPFQSGAPVVIGNPQEKGISLSSLSSPQPSTRIAIPAPPVIPAKAGIQSSYQNPNPPNNNVIPVKTGIQSPPQSPVSNHQSSSPKTVRPGQVIKID